MKRRQLLAGAAGLGALTGPAAVPSSPGATGSMAGAGQPTIPALIPGGPLMNLDWAGRIMEEERIDALVLGEGTNFYHATGHRPVTSTMGFAPTGFAIVTRQADAPPTLVIPAFTYYFILSDSISTSDYPVYLYTAPVDGDPDSAAPVSVYPDRQEAPLDDIERRRASLTYLAAEEQQALPALANALTKALTDAGVAKGTLAFDVGATGALLADALPKATFVDASRALSRIRPVKSEREIALMRQAASVNAEAALAAVRAVRAGASYRELRGTFAAEAARRGNRSVFIVIDRVSSEYFDAPFRDGQAFLIDAVSEYQGYHGDYGRTVFIGEPHKSMAQATEAIGQAWDEVRHALKPGMRFSEISSLGAQTLKKLGVNYPVPFGPHSVGLYHTDNVDQHAVGLPREDLTLQPGMIISVDCPLLAAGIGGSAHLEDLVLITADGSEAINAPGDQVILV